MRKIIFVLNLVISLIIMIINIMPSLFFNLSLSLFNAITTTIWLFMVLILYHYTLFKGMFKDEDDV